MDPLGPLGTLGIPWESLGPLGGSLGNPWDVLGFLGIPRGPLGPGAWALGPGSQAPWPRGPSPSTVWGLALESFVIFSPTIFVLFLPFPSISPPPFSSVLILLHFSRNSGTL